MSKCACIALLPMCAMCVFKKKTWGYRLYQCPVSPKCFQYLHVHIRWSNVVSFLPAAADATLGIGLEHVLLQVTVLLLCLRLRDDGIELPSTGLLSSLWFVTSQNDLEENKYYHLVEHSRNNKLIVLHYTCRQVCFYLFETVQVMNSSLQLCKKGHIYLMKWGK